MERSLYRLLNQEQTRPFSLRGERVQMRLLTARQLLTLALAEEADGDEFTRALRAHAALTAAVLRDGEEPLFESTEEVLDTLSAEEINRTADTYRRWSGEIDPGFDAGEEDIEALKKA